MYILVIKGRFICLCNRYYNVIYSTIIYATNISGGVVVVDDDSARKKKCICVRVSFYCVQLIYDNIIFSRIVEQCMD
jgi:hypothetical protein